MIRTISNPIISLIYPQACQYCGKSVEIYSDGVACDECWKATRIFNGSETLCGKCGAFLRESASAETTFCRQCADDHFDSARSAGIYEKAFAASILHLKKTPFVSSRIKNVFLEAFLSEPVDETTVIIPVPLSRKRFLERGFNQAEVLAAILSKAAGLKLDPKNLVRKVHTPIHRTAMDKKARELTVRNAFEVRFPRLIKDQNILLVDDVFTSGATVSYCAKELKKNGARKVDVMTLARAPLSK